MLFLILQDMDRTGLDSRVDSGQASRDLLIHAHVALLEYVPYSTQVSRPLGNHLIMYQIPAGAQNKI